MSKICDICWERPSFGHNVEHCQKQNIQNVASESQKVGSKKRTVSTIRYALAASVPAR